jgi:putative methyltransferase (TIGR04325 family)
MGIRGIAKEIAYSRPLQDALNALGKWPAGKALLNEISHPRGVYGSFPEAWAAAGRGRHAGHDHIDSVKTHFALSERLRSSDYAALYWISQINRQEICVFDFGGNIGNLFYSYRPYLSRRFARVVWKVMDLPMVCEEGRKLARERNEKNLTFTETVKDAKGCDLLLVSGSFHYWERPIGEFLSQFETAPPRIIVNRTPTQNEGPSYITVQNAGTYAVPCIVRNESEMATEFAKRGYRLADQWKAAELALRLPLFPSKTVRMYSGFYFARTG